MKWRKIAQARRSYLLIAPSFALVAAFLYYPALSGIYHAFTRWQTVGVSIWVGIDNFVAMASDPFISHGITNQLMLSLADFAKALIPPFIVAELIYALPRERERYWMRTFFVLPMVAPMMVIILMRYFIYDANMGLLNQTLGALGLDSWRQAWLGDPDFALGSTISPAKFSTPPASTAPARCAASSTSTSRCWCRRSAWWSSWHLLPVSRTSVASW